MMITSHRFWTLFGFSLLACASQSGNAESIPSSKATLTVAVQKDSAAGVTVSLSSENRPAFDFLAAEPLSLQLLDSSGATNWLSGGYASVVCSGQSLRCAGELRSPSGSVFVFSDTYTPAQAGNAFVLARDVAVRTISTHDAGFLTRFSLRCGVPSPLREHDLFIPGIRYLDTDGLQRGPAADLSADYIILREDRMPLPLVMMRNRRNGATITLIHLEPDGSTCLADRGVRAIDGRIQVASLGAYSQANAAVGIYYPAAEGDRASGRVGGQRGGASGMQTNRWTERFHPVQSGVKHHYQVLVDLSEQPEYSKGMRHAWRTAFELIHPPTIKTDVQASYEASIKLIADWSLTTNGASGIPFRLRLPKGELEGPQHINFQMGFVGQQLPLAYHLLRYGLLNNHEEIMRKGEAMVDFWAANSLTPEGLPRTWYDTYPKPQWRRYDTYMRVAADGMVGALMAWDVMQQYGRAKPEWIKFCKGFGDWLIKHQNEDGSWYRAYAFDSQPVNQGKQNTSHPIRFLLDLAKATGEKKYLDAALRAADFCYRTVHEKFAYVGGTADNPNVIDKEAGFISMDAFLALHDVTGEKRWLDAAAQAGDFTETWAYSWRIPIPDEDKAATYPRGAATTGFSLIATGQSGADLFLAGAPFFFYRLYLKTGDAHYAEMARQLLHDTKSGMDINGSLGYGHTGLCTEALSLVPPRGHGVNTWLPWLTYSMIEPIVRLKETYGMMDTPTAAGTTLEQLHAQDKEFGSTRGLFSAKARATGVVPH